MRHPIDARALIPVTALHICTNGARTVARLTGLGARARQRAGELIDRLGLGDIVERRVGEVSGGCRRRIDLAASLVGSPSVLFLDEPTTGLDPTARAALWDVVGELNASGTTVVLTTQYLDEADRLADDIVVLDHGRIAARGTPAELKRLVGGKVVTVTIPADDARRCWCCSARCSAPSPTVRTSQPG